MTAPAEKKFQATANFKRYSISEYLETERKTGQKHYFLNGKIIPMAGGTIPHTRIGGNIFYELRKALADNPDFEVFNCDQKIYLPKYSFYNYADALCVTGEPEIAEQETTAITNPILIVEVLSSSTEGYDRGQKFTEYKSLPSLLEYVLIRQDRPEIHVFYREREDLWHTSEFSGIHNEVYFKSINVKIPLAAIYARIKFSAEAV